MKEKFAEKRSASVGSSPVCRARAVWRASARARLASGVGSDVRPVHVRVARYVTISLTHTHTQSVSLSDGVRKSLAISSAGKILIPSFKACKNGNMFLNLEIGMILNTVREPCPSFSRPPPFNMNGTEISVMER